MAGLGALVDNKMKKVLYFPIGDDDFALADAPAQATISDILRFGRIGGCHRDYLVCRFVSVVIGAIEPTVNLIGFHGDDA